MPMGKKGEAILQPGREAIHFRVISVQTWVNMSKLYAKSRAGSEGMFDGSRWIAAGIRFGSERSPSSPRSGAGSALTWKTETGVALNPQRRRTGRKRRHNPTAQYKCHLAAPSDICALECQKSLQRQDASRLLQLLMHPDASAA